MGTSGRMWAALAAVLPLTGGCASAGHAEDAARVLHVAGVTLRDRAGQEATASVGSGMHQAVERFLATPGVNREVLFASISQGGLEPEGGDTELPPVDVKAERLSDSTLVGENGQPDWTTRRRFATTRSYVRAPGQVEAESWWRGKTHRGEGPEHRFQQEIGVGLPYRFQLDLYENWERGPGGPLVNAGTQVEARHALANWGEIPLNPTLYGEYKWNRHAADSVEAKLLLADDLAPRWHWATNLTWERELGGANAIEMVWSVALSHTVIDPVLGVGAELVVEQVTEDGARGHAANEVLFGPSVQWRITDRTHLDIVPLYGVTKDAPRTEVFIVFGYDFGGPSGGVSDPTSTKSR